MKQNILLSLFMWASLLHADGAGGIRTTILALSAACPPAGAIVAVAEVVAFGVAGVGMYCAHEKLAKNKKSSVVGKKFQQKAKGHFTGLLL